MTSRNVGITQEIYMTLHQEIDTLRKSIGRVWFSWSYDQKKSTLCKCVILSQIENIENLLFKFLSFGQFVHFFVLFKFPKVQQLI